MGQGPKYGDARTVQPPDTIYMDLSMKGAS